MALNMAVVLDSIDYYFIHQIVTQRGCLAKTNGLYRTEINRTVPDCATFEELTGIPSNDYSEFTQRLTVRG
jgi:hypothetical protein